MTEQEKVLWDELVAMQIAPRDAFDREDAARTRRTESSCDGKVRHRTKNAAIFALRKLQQTPRQKLAKPAPDGFEIYECRHCGGWHVGTVSKGRR